MPIQELTPLSLVEVNELIAERETRYRIPSEDLVQDPAKRHGVPEDDLAEWLFLLEQKRALLEQSTPPHQVGKTYLREASGPVESRAVSYADLAA
jgi:hypothetical protein